MATTKFKINCGSCANLIKRLENQGVKSVSTSGDEKKGTLEVTVVYDDKAISEQKIKQAVGK